MSFLLFFFLGKKHFCLIMWWQLLLRYSWYSVAWPNHLRWFSWQDFSMDTISVCPNKDHWSSHLCRSFSLSSRSLPGLGLNVHLLYLGESSPRKLRGFLILTVSIFLGLGKATGQILGIKYGCKIKFYAFKIGAKELRNSLWCCHFKSSKLG